MPALKHSPDEMLNFGDALRQALVDTDRRDPTIIGQQVAQAQIHPPRVHVPYISAYVESWLTGRSLPGKHAFAAILTLLPEAAHSPLKEAYLRAKDVAPPDNELSTALLTRYNAASIEGGLWAFSDMLAEKGVAPEEGTIYSPPGLSQWMHGSSSIPETALDAVDALLPPPAGEPTLREISAMRRRELLQKPEKLGKAAADTDIHRAFRHMREATGLSMHEFAKALSDALPGDRSISHVGLRKWELLPTKDALSCLPTSRVLDGASSDVIIEAYGAVLEREGFKDWFDTHKQPLCDLLRSAYAPGHEGGWQQHTKTSEQAVALG